MNYLEDVRKLHLKDLTEISKMNFSSSDLGILAFHEGSKYH